MTCACTAPVPRTVCSGGGLRLWPCSRSPFACRFRLAAAAHMQSWLSVYPREEILAVRTTHTQGARRKYRTGGCSYLAVGDDVSHSVANARESQSHRCDVSSAMMDAPPPRRRSRTTGSWRSPGRRSSKSSSTWGSETSSWVRARGRGVANYAGEAHRQSCIVRLCWRPAAFCASSHDSGAARPRSPPEPRFH